MPRAIEIVLVTVVVIAAWSDWQTRRIPNWITVSGATLGLGLHAWYGGLQDLWTSLEGAVVGLAIFIVFFIAGGMGAGDVKLFGAVGALVGPEALVLVFVFTGLLGGIAAAGVGICRRDWRATLPYGAVICAGTLLFVAAERICRVIEY